MIKDQNHQRIIEFGHGSITQAREIIRAINTQMKIFHQAKEQMSDELIDFAGKTGDR